VLRANPQYRGPGAPFADKLIFDFYSTKTGMLAAAKKGEIDVTTDYTLADLKQLEQGNGRYAVHKIPGFTIEHLEFNLDKTINGKPNPLHDVRVRQALALAVDKVEMMRVAFGISEAEARQVVAYSPLIVTPGFVQPFGDRSITGQWDPIAKKYVAPGPQAIAHARQLLAQAGYATGFDLRFATTSGNTVRAAQATAILKMWSEIGVRGALDTIPASHFFGQWGTNGPLARGDFQVAMFAFLGGSDPDGLKTNMVSTYIDRQARNHSSVNGNYAGIQDPAIDEAFRTGAGSFDPKVRQAAYSRMQEVMNQKAYWVPLFSRPSIDTASTRLEGFASNPTLLGPTWNVFAWRVAGTPAT
jgi:peptide/nickel transport system substrate-binding protein